LALNLKQGIHTLVFGIPGAGKTAILLEASSRISKDRLCIAYLDNCSSRRNLLENAMANVHKNSVRTQAIPIRNLRDALLKACKKQRLCLVLDHVPAKLHYRMPRLLEMLRSEKISSLPVMSTHVLPYNQIGDFSSGVGFHKTNQKLLNERSSRTWFRLCWAPVA
jgi:hypothetical protein